jgi:hypothetical protein
MVRVTSLELSRAGVPRSCSSIEIMVLSCGGPGRPARVLIYQI